MVKTQVQIHQEVLNGTIIYELNRFLISLPEDYGNPDAEVTHLKDSPHLIITRYWQTEEIAEQYKDFLKELFADDYDEFVEIIL